MKMHRKRGKMAVGQGGSKVADQDGCGMCLHEGVLCIITSF